MSDPRITFDSLHKGERDRLKAIQTRAEVYLAKKHPRLRPISVRRILDELLLSEPRVFHHVVSGSAVEVSPDDDRKVAAVVNDLVAGDENIQRDIRFKDDELRGELGAEFDASLKVGEALRLERAGQLNARREAFIEEGLRRV